MCVSIASIRDSSHYVHVEQCHYFTRPYITPSCSAHEYNHWEDDDYNRYLSDLFWDDMFDSRHPTMDA
jgi:hypothetical protein